MTKERIIEVLYKYSSLMGEHIGIIHTDFESIASELLQQEKELTSQPEPEVSEITDQDIKKEFKIIFYPHTIADVELNNEMINKRKGAKWAIKELRSRQQQNLNTKNNE